MYYGFPFPQDSALRGDSLVRLKISAAGRCGKEIDYRMSPIHSYLSVNLVEASFFSFFSKDDIPVNFLAIISPVVSICFYALDGNGRWESSSRGERFFLL